MACEIVGVGILPGIVSVGGLDVIAGTSLSGA
jgi:hypothetical protein